MTPTSNAKAAAKELARVWGQRPNVYRHWDESETHSVDIASGDNSPFDGTMAVGTVGLSDHALQMGGPRVELVGSFLTSFKEGPNVAATCAFNGFKDGMPIQPDAIHPNVLALYDPATTVPHILLTDPFLWLDGPTTLEDGSFKIAWLMMVPISESERRFAEASGADALTTLFEKHQIDIFDLRRPAVV